MTVAFESGKQVERPAPGLPRFAHEPASERLNH
jgi:hypothetical protein